jgi:ParB-like chromosome segregation protein Spo0J
MVKRLNAESFDFQDVLIAIDLIDPHPANYRDHPDSQIEKICASLSEFGQTKAIVVIPHGDERYSVIAGHGVRLAAMRLGWTHLRCSVKTWDDARSRGYIAADNMRGAQDDDSKYLDLIREWDDLGYDLAAIGSSDEELAALAMELDIPVGDVDVQPREKMVPRSQAKQQIKPVLYAAQVEVFEQALRKTGMSNRGEALIMVCRYYVNDGVRDEFTEGD